MSLRGPEGSESGWAVETMRKERAVHPGNTNGRHWTCTGKSTSPDFCDGSHTHHPLILQRTSTTHSFELDTDLEGMAYKLGTASTGEVEQDCG